MSCGHWSDLPRDLGDQITDIGVLVCEGSSRQTRFLRECLDAELPRTVLRLVIEQASERSDQCVPFSRVIPASGHLASSSLELCADRKSTRLNYSHVALSYA